MCNSPLKFYYQNVNGIRSKTHEFYLSTSAGDYDFILLSETFLNDSVCNGELFDLNNYTVYRRDRNYIDSNQTKGGGVLIAVKNNTRIKSVVRCFHLESSAEDLWLLVRLNTFSVYICCSYLLNNLILESFESHLNKIESICMSNPDSMFIIAGDYNLPGFVNGVNKLTPFNPKSNKLLNTLNFCNLNQKSQVFNYSDVMLDLIFSNEDFKVCEVDINGLLVPIDTHHPALVFEVDDGNDEELIQLNEPALFKFWNADYNLLNDVLLDCGWDQLLGNSNINNMTCNFYDKIYEIIEAYVPKMNKNKKYPIWFTKSLIKVLKEKNKFHGKWKTYKNIRDYSTFSMLRSRFKKLSNVCYKKYICLIEDNIVADIKSFWDYVKSKKSNSNGLPKKLHLGDKHASSNEEIGDLFADYFQKVYEDKNFDVQPAPEDWYNISISDIRVTPVEIFLLLEKLDPRKSGGPDLIPPIFLKRCAASLAYPVSILFNKSLSEAVFPDLWKKSFITPIFKSGSRNDIANYRPICKSSGLAKVLEGIVTTTLSQTFKSIIINQQHGFCKGRSTATNLMAFSEFLHRHLDDHGQVDVVYTDFEKAFDKVSHSVLFQKLRNAGIHGNLLRWIISYILNRTQIVKIGSSMSKNIFVTSGVPQGSHLGPWLFLLYINDINSTLKKCKFQLFADDLKMYSVIDCDNDCLVLQKELEVFASYCEINKLKLNIKKCCVISYTKRTVSLRTFDYKLCNSSLIRSSEIKDLGVYFDHKLNFKKHIEIIVNKSLKMLGFLIRICSKFRKIQPIMNIYKSIVRSQIEYCSVIWNPHYNLHINNIESVQKRFCRYVFRKNVVSYHEDYHYRIFLKVINLEVLSCRRNKFDLLFVFKALNNYYDSESFLMYFNFSIPRFNRRSEMFFKIEDSNTNVGLFSPINRIMRSYNLICSEMDIFNLRLSSFTRKIDILLAGI